MYQVFFFTYFLNSNLYALTISTNEYLFLTESKHCRNYLTTGLELKGAAFSTHNIIRIFYQCRGVSVKPSHTLYSSYAIAVYEHLV